MESYPYFDEAESQWPGRGDYSDPEVDLTGPMPPSTSYDAPHSDNQPKRPSDPDYYPTEGDMYGGGYGGYRPPDHYDAHHNEFGNYPDPPDTDFGDIMAGDLVPAPISDPNSLVPIDFPTIAPEEEGGVLQFDDDDPNFANVDVVTDLSNAEGESWLLQVLSNPNMGPAIMNHPNMFTSAKRYAFFMVKLTEAVASSYLNYIHQQTVATLNLLEERFRTLISSSDGVSDYYTISSQLRRLDVPIGRLEALIQIAERDNTIPSRPQEAPMTTVSVGLSQSGNEPESRERTGVPFNDGLIGIEQNPGPPKKSQGKRGARKKAAKSKDRRKGLFSTNKSATGTNRNVSVPAAIAYKMPKQYNSPGAGHTFLGTPCTRFVGRHLIGNTLTVSGAANTTTIAFPDGTTSNYVYMNPRICCQGSNYNTNPSPACPITRIASAYEKFCFVRASIEYVPLGAGTSLPNSHSFGFVPDCETTVSATLLTNRIAMAMLESSTLIPVWRPGHLDLTPYLDKSRWYDCEIDNATLASTYEKLTSVIQGVVVLCNDNGGVVTAQSSFGLIYMAYELVVYDMGPFDLGATPLYLKDDIRAHLLCNSEEKKETHSILESKVDTSANIVDRRNIDRKFGDDSVTFVSSVSEALKHYNELTSQATGSSAGSSVSGSLNPRSISIK